MTLQTNQSQISIKKSMDKNSQEILIIRFIMWKNHKKYWSLICLFSLLSEGYFKLQMLHVVKIIMCSSLSLCWTQSCISCTLDALSQYGGQEIACWTVFCHIPDIQHFCHHCVFLACVCQGNRQTCIQLHILSLAGSSYLIWRTGGVSCGHCRGQRGQN